jgi:deoxyribodipyrimidine photo-lyase
MKLKKILVWFRNDLRLHDNEMLVEAIAKSDAILPVYFFDPRHFTFTTFDTLKTGVSRTRFLLESIAALRAQFMRLGGNLQIIVGKPEEQISDLVAKFEISEVYHHREVGPEETNISAMVEDVLWKQQVNLKHFIGHTLYNKEDLPFPIKDIPDVFAQFKKKTERDAIVKSCIETPVSVSFIENEDWGSLPELNELGFETEVETAATLRFQGGEEAGLAHMVELLAPGSDIYKKISNKNNLEKFSAKLSPWLASGCLSPRRVYWMIKEAEQQFGANQNFNQILLGLLYRDYYRFMFKKHGIKFFHEADFESQIQSPEQAGDYHLEQWKKGKTGHSLVDRYMQELESTGYISHTGRLLVATYLVHILKVHWTNGASYFEEKLVDYSTASNWGNWANVAGAGLDLKSKMFDLDKQIKALEVDLPGVSA